LFALPKFELSDSVSHSLSTHPLIFTLLPGLRKALKHSQEVAVEVLAKKSPWLRIRDLMIPRRRTTSTLRRPMFLTANQKKMPMSDRGRSHVAIVPKMMAAMIDARPHQRL
jgi:hypothetical protein